jgi:hypothetical protein
MANRLNLHKSEDVGVGALGLSFYGEYSSLTMGGPRARRPWAPARAPLQEALEDRGCKHWLHTLAASVVCLEKSVYLFGWLHAAQPGSHDATTGC